MGSEQLRQLIIKGDQRQADRVRQALTSSIGMLPNVPECLVRAMKLGLNSKSPLYRLQSQERRFARVHLKQQRRWQGPFKTANVGCFANVDMVLPGSLHQNRHE